MFIKLLALKLFKNLLKIFCKEDAGAIGADLGASILPTRNNYANLEVTFEGVDPPEGVVRLNNNLIKQIP